MTLSRSENSPTLANDCSLLTFLPRFPSIHPLAPTHSIFSACWELNPRIFRCSTTISLSRTEISPGKDAYAKIHCSLKKQKKHGLEPGSSPRPGESPQLHRKRRGGEGASRRVENAPIPDNDLIVVGSCSTVVKEPLADRRQGGEARQPHRANCNSVETIGASGSLGRRMREHDC